MTQHVRDQILRLLEGTLSEADRADVLEHLRECTQCRRTLEWARTLADEGARHLSADQLALLGESDPSEIDMEDWCHLAACPFCRTEFVWSRSLALSDAQRTGRREADAPDTDVPDTDAPDVDVPDTDAPAPAAATADDPFRSYLSVEVQHALEVTDAFVYGIECVRRVGRDSEGLLLAEYLLEARREHLRSDHIDIAEPLQYISDFSWKMARFDEAETAICEAIEIQKKELGPRHVDVAHSLSVRVTILRQVHDNLSEAESLAREALGILRNEFGPEDPQSIIALHNVGWVLTAQGRLAEAEETYREALRADLRSPTQRSRSSILSTHNLAKVLQEQGHLAAAEPLFWDSLAKLRDLIGEDHSNVPRMLGNLGKLRQARGDLAGAERLLRDCEAAQVRILGPDHPDRAETWISLGRVAEARGDLGAAKNSIVRALALQRTVFGAEYHGCVATLCHLGRIEIACSNFEAAEAAFLSAQALEDTSPAMDAVRGIAPSRGLAQLAEARGKYTDAAGQFGGVLLRLRAQLPSLHPEVVQGLLDLARVCVAQYDYPRAGILFAEAQGADPALANAPETHRLYTAVLLELGREAQAWESAERSHTLSIGDRWLGTIERELNSEDTDRVHTIRGRGIQRTKEIEAIEETLHSLATADPQSDPRSTALRSRLETAVPVRWAAEVDWRQLLVELTSRFPVRMKGGVLALTDVQRSLSQDTALVGWVETEERKGSWSRWAYVIRSKGDVQWTPLVGRSVGPISAADIDETRRQVKSWLHTPPRPGSEQGYEDADGPDAHLRVIETLFVQPLVPLLSGVRNVIAIPSGSILGIPLDLLGQGRDPAGESGWLYAPSATVYAWNRLQAPSEDGFRAGEKPAGPRLNPLFIGAPQLGGSDGDDRVDGHGHGDRPVEGDAHGDAQVNGDNPGDLLAADPDTSGQSEESLLRRSALGDRSALERLSGQPNAREEIERSAAKLPGSTVWFGPEAQRAELRTWLEATGRKSSPRILHLASPVLIDNESPGRSAILFSFCRSHETESSVDLAAKDGEEILTADEIARTWNVDVDLVVLSGCNSGLGRRLHGAGHLGMANALLQAGARSVIVSLWEVDPAARALFFERFYAVLGERTSGQNIGEFGGRGTPLSLRATLQDAGHFVASWVDENGETPLAHPHYWAGYILVGEA